MSLNTLLKLFQNRFIIAMANVRRIQLSDTIGGFKTIWILIFIKIGTTDCTSCPPGWISRSGSCYFVSTYSKTWHEARTICQGFDAHLVIINDSAENQFLKALVTRSFWIGLSDLEVEGNLKFF